MCSSDLTTANLDFHVVDLKRNVLNDPTSSAVAGTAKVIVQINVGTVPPFNAAGTAAIASAVARWIEITAA